MSADLQHGYADLGEVLLHYVSAGEGEPLVLLHGWPQSWYEWRRVLPALAAGFRVIAPDLRGLGDSSRPPGGYDKRTMAGDIWRLLEHLGIGRCCVVGHDWGGPVAFALAMAHPEAVRRLAILDVVIPGDGGDFSQGGRRWHHAFHMTGDLPEALVTGRERIYLEWFYRNFAWRPDAIGAAEIEEYLRTYTQPGALRAGFALYRALPQDRADNAAAIAQGKLKMPVLAVGGGRSFGRGQEVEQSLRRVAEDVTGAVIPDCGHWIPEEQPQLLLDHLLPFLRNT
jgi:pimeloyl-ACP methyl ester carboxylesterase